MNDAAGTKKTHHDVFISYAQEDKTVADTVCAKLEAKNIRCWIAPRDVPPGKDFPEAIIDGIEGGRIMIVIFSSYANSSPHVIRELTNAVNKGRIIIPFRIEDVVPSKSMEYLIGVPHWLDAVTPPLEKHIGVLEQTILCIIGTDSSPAACLAQAKTAISESPASSPGTTTHKELSGDTEPLTGDVDTSISPDLPVSPGIEVQESLPDSCQQESLSPQPEQPRSPPVPVPALPPQKRIIIAITLIAFVVLAAIAIMAGGGFLFPQGSDSNTTTATPASHPGISDADYYQGTNATVDTVVLTTAPTQTLAKDTELYVDVNKDMSKAIVTVQFNGGPGIGLVRDNRIILTRSDGTVAESKLNFDKRLSSIQLQGSRGTDRIQVIVILHSGESRTIIDKLLEYRKYR